MNPTSLSYSVAGLPSFASDGEQFDLASHLIQHPNDTFYVRVSGNNMIESGIHDGDLLIVDRAAEPRPSDVVVAWAGNGFTVKRLGRLCLVSPRFGHAIEIDETAGICGVAKFAIHQL